MLANLLMYTTTFTQSQLIMDSQEMLKMVTSLPDEVKFIIINTNIIIFNGTREYS